MACGTPVIAPSASVPEVVEDGVTGFIIDGGEDAVRAVRELPRLDRQVIRAPGSRNASRPSGWRGSTTHGTASNRGARPGESIGQMKGQHMCLGQQTWHSYWSRCLPLVRP